MKAEKLVEACTLESEIQKLAFALAVKCGVNRFLNIAWDAFWVDGTEQERAEFQREIADIQKGIAWGLEQDAEAEALEARVAAREASK